jgi:hypothetical protein
LGRGARVGIGGKVGGGGGGYRGSVHDARVEELDVAMAEEGETGLNCTVGLGGFIGEDGVEENGVHHDE